MKKLVVVLIFVFVCIPYDSYADAGVSSKEDLLKSYKMYLEQRDINGIRSLVYPVGVTATQLDIWLKDHASYFDYEFEEIKLDGIEQFASDWIVSEPPSKEIAVPQYYYPNLQPEGYISLKLKKDSHANENKEFLGAGVYFFYGQKDGKYYILQNIFKPRDSLTEISSNEILNFIDTVKDNNKNWPLVTKRANHLFASGRKLPDNYAELLKPYFKKSNRNVSHYELYEYREDDHHGGWHSANISVYEETSRLRYGVTELKPVPIYDQCWVERVDKVIDSKPVVVLNEISPVGNISKSSILQHSLARVAPDSLLKQLKLRDFLNVAMEVMPPGEEHDKDPVKKLLYDFDHVGVKRVISLYPIRSAVVEYEGFSVRTSRYILNAEGKADHYGRQPRFELLWIERESGKDTTPIYVGLSLLTMGDSTSRKEIFLIADSNKDGSHEIVINDLRYAGNSYILISFEASGKASFQSIDGAGWD